VTDALLSRRVPRGTQTVRIRAVQSSDASTRCSTAVGQPSLLDTASPILGALSVAVSSLLSLAVLAALVLLTREARANQRQPAGSER
jgi:hypothetical protein